LRYAAQVNRPKHQDRLRDIGARQRNIVFSDTVDNGGRFWHRGLLFASGLLIGALALAQNGPATAPQESQLTVRSRAELVLVPVAVTDKSTAHVYGLSRTDFEIEENGKPQRIALFEEIVDRPRSETPRNPGEHKNYIGDQASRRLTIILLDQLNSPYLNIQEARREFVQGYDRRARQ
jgi:hypothetical protein